MRKRPSAAQLDLFGESSAAPPVEPIDEGLPIEIPRGLRLERNLALLAGAGAGKTYSLVTMCLHLLGGARRGFAPISPADLGLLTFTEKAADEMRSRLRQRLDALAQGSADEVELRASFQAAGVAFPPPSRWRALRDDLGAATIGTFHSLCMQLLRRAPEHSGFSPQFELLDEREARALVHELVENEVLARVEQRTPLRALVAELGFERLVEALVPVAARIREEGLLPQYVRVADPQVLKAQFEAEREGLLTSTRNQQPPSAALRLRWAQALEGLSGLTFDDFEAGFPLVQEAFKGVRGWSELRDSLQRLSQLHAACAVAPYEVEVRDVLVQVAAAHETTLAQRRVLDFTGLLVQARNLLRDVPQARLDAQRRFKALLVDEFQDTNRLQLELVLLLAEQRQGAPRPVSTAFEVQHHEITQLPQERGFLAVVGDRKQSIYEFRGADVSVFEVMARAIENHGGGRAYLRHSRRSTAPLLQALNLGFASVLGSKTAGGATHDFEVVYQSEFDDLIAVREGAPSGVPLVQLIDSRLPEERRNAESHRLADAETVAQAIAFGVNGGWSVLPRNGGGERPARGGEIAVLFQRFTQLEVYRQALVRIGVRHRVVRGRGFYSAQEVLDVASLLKVLVDPDDALSLSVVLRSPLVGLTDAQWVQLARPRLGSVWRLEPRTVLFGTDEALPPAVVEFQARYQALRAEHQRLGLRRLVRLALDVFEYPLAVAAGPFGEQGLANLAKLEALAQQREAQGVSVAAFAAEVLALADEAPKEAEGEVVDALDAEAVTLCTVHQAKGLEWPIVVLPDLATPLRQETQPVRFDRDLGLSVSRPKGVSEIRSWSAVQVSEQLTRRARAENLRLLYVAMTRARDRVILGLRPAVSADNTWARELDAFFAVKVSGDRPEQLDVAGLSQVTGAALVAAGDTVQVGDTLARVRSGGRLKPEIMVLPVTQAETLVSCLRRFHWAHQVGLPGETTADWAEADEEEALEAPAVDVRVRGTAAHRLLELTPLEWVGTPQLWERLIELRRTLGLERDLDDESLGWVRAFWGSALGRSLLGAEILREVPFALRLERPGRTVPRSLILRGQIDLVAVTNREVLVIDYKTAKRPAEGLDAYRFQLSAYALAAEQLLGTRGLRREGVSVRAGLVFLRDDSVEPCFFDSLQSETVVSSLWAAAESLTQLQGTGQWPGRSAAHCRATRCPYLSRCHP